MKIQRSTKWEYDHYTYLPNNVFIYPLGLCYNIEEKLFQLKEHAFSCEPADTKTRSQSNNISAVFHPKGYSVVPLNITMHESQYVTGVGHVTFFEFSIKNINLRTHALRNHTLVHNAFLLCFKGATL